MLLTTVVAGFVVLDSIVQRTLVLRRFGGYELDFAELRLNDVEERLATRRSRLASLARKEGIALKGMLDENLDAIPELDGLDLLFLVDRRGRVQASAVVDPETREPVRLREFPEQALSPVHALLEPRSTGGFIETERGLMLVGVADIAPVSSGDAPLRAIAGKFVDTAFLDELSPSQSTPTRLSTLSAADLSGDELGDALLRDMPRIEAVSEDSLAIEHLLVDVRGMRSILLRIEVPRDLAQLARESASDATLSAASAAILLLLTLVFLLQRGVVGPVRDLTEHAVLIRDTNDTTLRLNSKRRDEIGVLARELDRMVAELERSRNQASEIARQAGASEIAKGVLHNIGNVLNSLNVAAKLSAQSVATLPIDDLGVGVRELEAHADELDRFVTEDPRGKHLTPFLREIHAALVTSRGEILHEMHELLVSVEHIASLVQAHEGYATRVSSTTWVRTEEIIEQALVIATQARSGDVQVQIERDYRPTASVELERHKVLEILVNLLINAFDALDSARGDDPKIVVRVLTIDNDVVLEVEDNGVGIEIEDVERIFHLGFTKKAGGRGFGLHMSALAASEMGGRLEVFCAGPGAGATFRLTLPADKSQLAA